MIRRPVRLDPICKNYAWGSRSVLAEFQGRPPSPEPEAELWYGGHPQAPSMVEGRPVTELLDSAFPFLLKVLAVEHALSIQAHPDRAAAVRGFAAEEAQGVARSAPHRSYRDENEKPEMVVALSPFEALLGFRRASEIRAHFEAAPALLGALDEGGLKAFLDALLDGGPDLVERVLAPRRDDPLTRWCKRLVEQHPGDAGALSPLFLNLIRLEPGEALFVDAGTLHAYLSGTVVELMVTSDNVLRAGLTPKHVDREGLMSILAFTSGHRDIIRAETIDAHESRYQVPGAPFRLSRLNVRGEAVERSSGALEVLLVVEGQLTLESEAAPLVLRRGAAALIPDETERYRLHGTGRAFRARSA